MTVTEFISDRKVERQAVTRYINRHNIFFDEHIKREGRELVLDEKAVFYLSKVYPKEQAEDVKTEKGSNKIKELQEEILFQNEVINRLVEIIGIIVASSDKR